MTCERRSTPTLFDRQHELQVLEAGVDAAIAGGGHLYLLSGVPGVGKTSLLGYAARFAERKGAMVLWSRPAERDLALPGLPWRSIVGQLLARPVAASVDPVLVERVARGMGAPVAEMRAEPDQAPAAPSEESALIEAIAALLHEVARHQPLVLLMDDLQAAGVPSLLVLENVARALGSRALLIVGAYREVGAAAGVLRGRLAHLGRHSTAIPVRELDLAGTHALAARVMERDPSPPLAALLHEACGGNPFFLEELIRRLVADGCCDEPTLRADPIVVPSSVRATIRDWVAALPQECGAVLETAALVGRQFDADLIAPACDLDVEDAAAILSAAASGGLLQMIGGTVFRFRHGLTRATLGADLPPARRRALHAAIGTALERRHAGDLDAVLPELARHFAAGGSDANRARALRQVRQAGEQALARRAYDEAMTFFEHALTLVGADAELSVELRVRVAAAALRAGNVERARDAALTAAADARALRSAPLLAHAALAIPRADTARADVSLLTLLEEAVMGLGPDDAALKARVDAHLAHELALSGELQRGDAISRAAVTAARALDDAPTLAVTLAKRCKVLTARDEERLALSAELHDRAREIGDPELALEACIIRISDGLTLADDPDRDIRAAHRLSEEIGHPYYRWKTHLWRSMRASLVGDYDAGKRLAADAYAIGNAVRPRTARIVLTVQTIARLWQQGEAARLLSLVEGFVAEHGREYLAGAAGRIWALAQAGRHGEAARGLAVLAERDFTVAQGEPLPVVVGLLAETCAALGDSTYAGTLYERLRPFAGRLVVVGPAVECLGPVDRYLGLLASLQREWQVAEAHFTTSLEIARRLTATPFIARTLYNHAAMLGARGWPEDRPRAAAMLSDALAGAQRFGMARVEQEVRKAQAQLGERMDPIAPAAAGGEDPSLTCEGDHWTFRYRGSVCRMRDRAGMRYLAALLEQPHQRIAADHLTAAFTRSTRDVSRPPRQPAHAPRVAPAERARVLVTRALRSVIKRIGVAHPQLGAHLERSIRTGTMCSYAPADGSVWTVRRG